MRMRTYHWNGEHWYRRDWSLAHRLRHWCVWIGGWERPNGAGWRIVRPRNAVAGRMSWRSRLRDPWPLSLFGHTITWFGWGWQFRMPGGRGWLVRTNDRNGRRTPSLYLSHDGTPAGAVTWITGPPREVAAAGDLAREANVHPWLRREFARAGEGARTPLEVAERLAARVSVINRRLADGDGG